MTTIQIETNLNAIVQNIAPDTFVFDMLSAFGFPSATIKRLQHSKLIFRKHLLF